MGLGLHGVRVRVAWGVPWGVIRHDTVCGCRSGGLFEAIVCSKTMSVVDVSVVAECVPCVSRVWVLLSAVLCAVLWSVVVPSGVVRLPRVVMSTLDDDDVYVRTPVTNRVSMPVDVVATHIMLVRV